MKHAPVSLAAQPQAIALPPADDRPLDLPMLWDLALANNPSLQEAAADVDASRGRLVQAGLYPNPHVLYDQNTIGSRAAPQGNITVQLNQEIVTAGKRGLDKAVASRETTAAELALVGRRFDVLTRVRRAYYDCAGWFATLRTNEEVVAALERGRSITKRLVEDAKLRPETDLLRIEALVEEAKINLARSRANLGAALRQLGAEIGCRDLPSRAFDERLPDNVPAWSAEEVEHRVLAANTTLQETSVEVERSRLALARAKAQAVPNVTMGVGYAAENIDNTAGAVVSLEAPLPLWDRNQGNIRAAQARLARAEASTRAAETKLRRETATAYAAFEATKQQVERLTTGVLPRLEASLDQLRKGYEAGAPQVVFADVLQAEQSLLTTRLTLAEARRNLWAAVADLEGLMQLDLREELSPTPPPVTPVK